MKPLKVLTIGGITQDITFTTKQGVLVDNKQDLIQQKLVGFEFGAKLNIQDAEFGFGGGALNSAINLAGLDNQVSSLVCVGEDVIGQQQIKKLKEHKIKTDLVQKSEGKSGLSFVLKAGNLDDEHVLFTYRGVNEDLKVNFDELKKRKFDLIYVTSLSGKHVRNNLVKIFSYRDALIRKKVDAKLAWNPGNQQLKMGLKEMENFLKRTDILNLNKDEAIELCLEYKNKVRLNNPRELLKILSQYCPGIVVITDGGHGAYAIFENKIYFAESCKAKAKDTTGVGDAFGSTFVWALSYTNQNIEQALKLASRNACSVLKKTGAQNGLLTARQLTTNV